MIKKNPLIGFTTGLLIISAISATANALVTSEREVLPGLPRLSPRPVFVAGVDKLRVNLNGTWRFNPAPADGFWQADVPTAGGWAYIEVPGEWAMQGFEAVSYTHLTLPTTPYV